MSHISEFIHVYSVETARHIVHACVPFLYIDMRAPILRLRLPMEQHEPILASFFPVLYSYQL